MVLGWTVNARCSGGLSASTVANQVLGGLSAKYQVHCGLTVPIAACNAKSFSITIIASDPTPKVVNPGGGSRPARAFDMVIAYASAPAPIEIEPGPARVMPEPKPDAARCAPSDCPATAFTPVQAEMATPPSVTGCDKYAPTARMSPWKGSVLGSGKPCTFVATYVAIE